MGPRRAMAAGGPRRWGAPGRSTPGSWTSRFPARSVAQGGPRAARTGGARRPARGGPARTGDLALSVGRARRMDRPRARGGAGRPPATPRGGPSRSGTAHRAVALVGEPGASAAHRSLAEDTDRVGGGVDHTASVGRWYGASAPGGRVRDGSRLHFPGARAPTRMVALAQSAEHRIVAPKVTGSIPVGHPTIPARFVLTRRLHAPSILCAVPPCDALDGLHSPVWWSRIPHRADEERRWVARRVTEGGCDLHCVSCGS